MSETNYAITLEGAFDIRNATVESVSRAVEQFAGPQGPTYIIVQAADGSYVQAAGTEGRYVLESRDVYGEGFRHWRACRSSGPSGGKATIRYRRKCPKGEHPPRGCPLTVRREEVMSLAEVSAALVEFVASGCRIDGITWRDVSEEFVGRADEKEIQTIQPRARRSHDREE